MGIRFLLARAGTVLFCLMVAMRAGAAGGDDWPGGKPIEAARKAFAALHVIDQWNLRYYRPHDPSAIDPQVARIKRNMDLFSRLGFTDYVLVQRDTFPELLTWGGKHAPDERLRKAVREVIDHGKARGMSVHLHSNQFLWPRSVGVPYGDTPEAWAVYRSAIAELIALYPDLGGFQVTADETEGMLKDREGMLKLHNETARALSADGRRRLALMRTWQRVGEIMGPPETLGQGDEPNVLFSVRNTAGDVNFTNPFDTAFFDAVKNPGRLVVEFDAWREFETHNAFPLYMGDVWASRFKALADKGVQHIAVRIDWNSGLFPLADRPWANWVNIHAFVRLAEDPRANPDDILREFVALHYPPDARAAAFALYKHTPNYAKAIYYPRDRRVGDHGRINRTDRVRNRLGRNYLVQVEAEYRAMLAKIEALPPGTPYRDDLRKGAIVLSWVGRGMGLANGAPGDSRFVDDWRALDLESFQEFRGENVPTRRGR